MQGSDDILAKTEELRTLIQTQRGIKARNLERAGKRARRQLPSAARAQAAVLVEAEQMAANPKLARRLDTAALEFAYREVARHLDGLDPASTRLTRRLNMVAGLALNILLFAGLCVLFLWWRGVI